MHYSVLILQPSASPFDHKVPLSPVARLFIFLKISPFSCWYSACPSSCATRTHLSALIPITDHFHDLASGFSDTSSRQPTPTSASSLRLPGRAPRCPSAARGGTGDLLSVLVSVPGWFGRGAIGMILLKLLSFGVGTRPGLGEADAAPRKWSVGYAADPAAWDAPSPLSLVLPRRWGFGHTPKQRGLPMFQPLEGKSFAERTQLYKGL